MQIHELCNDTFYCALSMASLKQRALVEYARTLLFSRNQELIELMRRLVPKYSFPYDNVSPWYARWTTFRTTISDDINRLVLPNDFKRDVRAAVMCLFRSMCYFPKPAIFNPAMTIQFTPRGDVNVERTFEDYVKRIFRKPRLSRKKKCELLRDACHLCQERSIQWLLCELLEEGRSALVPTLRNARCKVEIRGGFSWDWKISFELGDVVDPDLWKSFARELTTTRLLVDLYFAFEQNVMRVSTLQGRPDGMHDITLVWSKLTTNQKVSHAKSCFKASLAKSDAYLAIGVLRFLDPIKRMEMMQECYIPIIMSFMRHFYDRHLLPDLVLPETDLFLRWNDIHLQVFRFHIVETVLEGEFCRDRRNVLAQLCQYISSRNVSFRDDIRGEIQHHLDRFVEWKDWLLDESVSDDAEVIFELQEQYSPP